MELTSWMKVLLVYSGLVAMTLFLYTQTTNYTLSPKKDDQGLQEKRETRFIFTKSQQRPENTTTGQTTNEKFIVNKDEFGVPENEPYLYIRSSYLDYRLNPPKTWVSCCSRKDFEIGIHSMSL